MKLTDCIAQTLEQIIRGVKDSQEKAETRERQP